MKSVLISIQPKWVEKIVNGKKTIEVRKTRPKIETPFKCYIYMTQGTYKDLGSYSEWIYKNRMKVIGEFVCDMIELFTEYELLYDGNYVEKETRVPTEELLSYKGKNDFLYGWHISNLKIYDKPISLSELGVTRLPQSWMYVEEVEK
jgi:predicted transcriptional regulator